MKSLIIIVLLGYSLGAFGQISFYKEFTNNGYDYAEGIVQTDDSSYLITGSSSSFGDGPAQAFLLKTDSLGNFKWSRNYGGSESEGGKRVMYIKDDGILVAGYTNSFGNGAYDFYLLKTDPQGNQMWEKSYGTLSWEKVNDAALTRDSGVIMVGETLNTIDGEPDVYIVRTDKNGNELWSQQIGGIGPDVAKCIEIIDDSTFVVGGGIFVPDSNVQKGLALKIEDNGTIWWQDSLGESGAYVINDIALETIRISYVGMQIKTTGDTADFYLKTDFSGVIDYEFNISNAGIEYAVGIAPFAGDRYVVISEADNQYSYANLDLFFYQYYTALFYESTIAGINAIGNEILGQIIPTSDMGAIAVGYLTQVGDGGSNIFVIKLYPGFPSISSNDSHSTDPLVTIHENNDLSLTIYPNPSDGIINIHVNGSPIKQIDITNMQGMRILSEKIVGDGDFKVDLTSFNSGVYFLNIVNIDNQMTVKRIVIR